MLLTDTKVSGIVAKLWEMGNTPSDSNRTHRVIYSD